MSDQIRPENGPWLAATSGGFGDGDGFVELRNTGDVPLDLAGLALVLVNGGDGTEYARSTLTGTLAAGAYHVVEIDPQNGAPDGVALVNTTTKALLDALSYEGAISAAEIAPS